VCNEEKQIYDAALKPYGTSVGAPPITTNDTSCLEKEEFKQNNS